MIGSSNLSNSSTAEINRLSGKAQTAFVLAALIMPSERYALLIQV
jgi:hypothetical protein